MVPTTTEDQEAGLVPTRNTDAASPPISSHGPARTWSYGDLDRHRAEVKLERAQRARLLRPQGILTLKIDVKVGEAKLARLRRPESVQSIRAENVRGKVVWKIVSPITFAGATAAATAALSPIRQEMDAACYMGCSDPGGAFLEHAFLEHASAFAAAAAAAAWSA
ncbi:hypothetical protein BD289DRAFT_481250 [Coniella lustricola]|uniref:Uncharacterized protein n=1 Tax=Coniella lustricola TaxID=2025994 RepID=A0A2T3ACY6_9PEZI|nr:hypothetical protein BD289DRAFT_481250 [Coniella lustricola]